MGRLGVAPSYITHSFCGAKSQHRGRSGEKNAAWDKQTDCGRFSCVRTYACTFDPLLRALFVRSTTLVSIDNDTYVTLDTYECSHDVISMMTGEKIIV